MSHNVRYIHRPRGKLTRDENAEVRQLLLPIQEDPTRSATLRLKVRGLLVELDRDTYSLLKEPFLMISPSQNLAVIRHLRATSYNATVAQELWALCLVDVAYTTGEILKTRHQLAAELGVTAGVVSRLMGELVKCGAVTRSFVDDFGHRGRGVRYFLNPRCGTHLPREARAKAMATAPILTVIDGSAHPSQRRPRAACSPRPVL